MPANMKKTAELVISLHVKKQFQCVYTHLEYRTTLVVFALILSQNHTCFHSWIRDGNFNLHCLPDERMGCYHATDYKMGSCFSGSFYQFFRMETWIKKKDPFYSIQSNPFCRFCKSTICYHPLGTIELIPLNVSIVHIGIKLGK